MSGLSRKEFLRSTGKALVASGLLAAGARGAKAAPSERVRHAIIGAGNQGKRHTQAFGAFSDCEIVAICDVDPERRVRITRELREPARTRLLDDFRVILDDPEVDSVSIATPDHWHTLLAILALQAGKHVYVEKPCSHNIREGYAIEAAAKKHGKCVQHGTQGRSSGGIREAVAFLRDGGLGKVRLAKAINHQLRGAIGREPETDPPPNVNYDMWLGPAPKRPFTKNRWHYQWHWFWDYGCGDIANDGIHQIDQARWGLGAGLPKAVTAAGGQLYYDDDHETPDTQLVTYEYDDAYLVFEMRLWTDYPMDGHDNGVIFYGDKGTLDIGRGGCEVTLIGEEKKPLGGGADKDAHVRNFLDCVKANDPTKLQAPIREGVVSSALCHLGNIATRVQRRVVFDEDRCECVGDAEATALLGRTYREGYELPAEFRA